MSWAEPDHERPELTMIWAELSELAHFDTPTYNGASISSFKKTSKVQIL